MNKIGCFIGFFCVLILLYSCEENANFDKSLLYGKWQQKTEFEKYMLDGTGYMWNEAEGVFENEAQKFEWTLENADLTQIHLMENGGKVPKLYKVTELTSTSFKYKDDYGVSHSFQRVD